MKFEEMSKEMIEKARACTTKEGILAFIQENHIDLSAEQMEQISGGVDRPVNRGSSKGHECDKSPDGYHCWDYTGKKRPGKIWGDIWPDYLHRCRYCHKEDWLWAK